jgi:ELWxxDGT repeat protein
MLMKRVLFPLLMIFGAVASLAAHPVPELVKDINTRPAVDGAKVQFPTAMGNTLFFTACDAAHGQELWKSDGTRRGTKLLKDVLPGFGSSFPRELTVVGNTLYFVADDFQHGFQLWKSDGTPDGTRMVKDLAGDTSGLAPKSLIAVGNKLFFLLPTDGPDRLWVSDGTEEGTVEVLPDDTSVDSPHDLIAFKETVVFVRGDSLYRSEGTAEGTLLLGRINPSLEYVQCFAGDDVLYFVTGRWSDKRLWKSDGSVAGTVLVTPLSTGVDEGVVIGNSLVFSMYGRDLGAELWCSDGTSDGTRLLKDLAPGPSWNGYPLGSYPKNFRVVGKLVYFTAEQPETGEELWRTDGTEAGTTLVIDLTKGAEGSYFSELQAVGEQLYFKNRNDLWVTNGTKKGTRLLKRESGRLGHFLEGRFESGENVLFFVASEQLWRTNGTKRGTIQLTALRDRTGNACNAYTSDSAVYTVGDRAFFAAFDGARTGPWTSRGTGNSTNRVKNFDAWNCGFYPAGDRVFIVTLDINLFGWYTNHLWVSDGTVKGTYRLPDGRGTEWDRAITGLEIIGTIGNELYFTNAYGEFGGEIWKSDGTVRGTTRMRAPGVVPLASMENPATEGTLFFSKDKTLYRTDGTAEGTYVVDATHEFWSKPSLWVGKLVYFSNSGLWCSDGTPAGTRRLLDPPLYSMIGPIAFKDKVFVFRQSKQGYGLWSADGTSQGVQLIVDGIDLETSSALDPFVAGNFLYFSGYDDANRLRLWRTDGTAGGTSIVEAQNIPDLNIPYWKWSERIVVGSVVYFAGSTEMDGHELWRTDGTTAGTYIVADLTGDSGSSDPGEFSLLGSQLLFWATTSEWGRELYSLDVSADLAPPP